MKQRRDLVINFLKKEEPHFLLLQETRCSFYEPIENYYEYHHQSTKGRNGVAIISKFPIKLIEMQEERFLHCKFGDLSIICVYVYNGGSILSPAHKKIEFLNFLKSKVHIEDKCIVGGDFNVLYNPYEYWNFNPYDEKQINTLKSFEEEMYFYQSNEKYYTWWDYRDNSFQKDRGMGLDKFYYKGIQMSRPVILKEYREYSPLCIPSDHAPISSIFSFN